jgi:hypothetical protein
MGKILGQQTKLNNNFNGVVEMRGLEPLTSALRTPRSPI